MTNSNTEVSIDTGNSGIVPTINIQDVDKLPPPPAGTVAAATSSTPSPPGALDGPAAASIPDWYKVGWRAVGGIDKPELEGDEKDHSVIAAFLSEQYYGDWYHNAALIFFVRARPRFRTGPTSPFP